MTPSVSDIVSNSPHQAVMLREKRTFKNFFSENRIITKWQKCREQGKDWLNRYWKNNVIREFHRRERQAGIDTVGKKLTVHILRKCCLQNWANELPMNVVKELAGHGSIETTNRFYSAVDEMHYDAVAKLGDKLLNTETTDRKLTFSSIFKENQEAEKC